MPSDTPREKPRNVPRKVPRKRAGGPRPWQVIVIVAAVAVLAGIAIFVVNCELTRRAGQAPVVSGNAEDIVRYRKTVEEDPKNPEAWYVLGVALRVSGNSSEAVRALERSVALAPDDLRYADDLARTLLSVGRATDAAVLWERSAKAAAATEEARVGFLLNAAESRIAAGEGTKAKANVKAALAISPSDPRALSLLKGLK
jgi:Flp pilus assembly protein TadD